MLTRTRTDPTNARRIARFCTPGPVLEVLAAQIPRIDCELADLATAEEELGPQLRLLTSIPGLGLATAATLLASRPIDRLTTAGQLAAYVGLWPQVRGSGASIRGRSQPGPLGPAHLRTALYPPTLVAMRVNPALRAFADRFRRAGTRSNVIVVALMRKLLLLASAILRSGRPYSPAHR